MTNLYDPPDSLVYEKDDWTDYQWKKAVEKNTDLDFFIKRGTEKLYSFSTFGKEVFARFHNLELEKKEAILPEHQWAEKLHAQLDNNNDFIKVKNKIANLHGLSYAQKFYLSCLGTSTVLAEIEQKIPDTDFVNPNLIRKNYLKQKQNNPDDKKSLENIKSQGEQQVQKQQQLKLINNKKLNEIIKTALYKVNEQTEQFSVFGWGDTSTALNNTSNLNELLTLTSLINDNSKLKEIIKLAGNFKLAYLKTKKSRIVKNTLKSEIGLGNDLINVLPQEWNYYTNLDTRNLFYLNYIQHSLLQYESNKQQLNLGPIALAIDVSGSTKGLIEIWIKAIALLILNVARKQKRDFYLCLFNGDIQTQLFVDRKNKVNNEQILKTLCKSATGGTNFQKPFDRCLEVIKKTTSFKTADIIMITDGDCDVNPAWLKSFKAKTKKLNINTYGVLVMQQWDTLNKIVDRVTFIDNTSTAPEELFNSL